MLAAARAMAEAGDAPAALAAAHGAVAAAPEDAATRLAAASIEARWGDPAAALALLEPALTAIRADQESLDHLAMLAGLLATRGAVAEAAALLGPCWRASHRPMLRAAFVPIALAAHRRGLNAGADGALLEDAAAAIRSALPAIAARDLAEFARLAEEAGRGDLLRQAGLAAIAAGEATQARRLVGLAPGAPATPRGLELAATGQAARGAVAFALALAEAPRDPAARLNAGWAALGAGDASAAEAAFAGLRGAPALVMAQAGWPAFDSLPWPYGAPPAAAPRLPDGARWPRIRLVTPCLNPGPWLEETILSVAAQGYPLVEHVVVDGGSTDGTAAILARHRHRLAAVIVGRDGGPAEAIAKGLAGSTADLLGWLNADDMLAPGALHRLAAAWRADPEADIVHGDAIAHRARRLVALQRPLPDGPGEFSLPALADIFGRWAQGRFFLGPEAIFTRRLWDRLGGRLDASLRACFDYEFWLRAAAAGARPVAARWPTAFYRLHQGQISGGRARVAREQAMVRARFHSPAPPAARAADIRARVAAGLAAGRLLLVDPWGAAPRDAARAALAAQGIALSTEPFEGPGLALRLLRPHDPSDWPARLRADGFTGAAIGWMLDAEGDPDALAAHPPGLDIAVPADAAQRDLLLSEAAFVTEALPLPAALTALVAALRGIAAA
ncbi:glycosyltransferase [Roseomonas sp. PWR1]|uniref:Glycosyltransferase n=1 Tax=Roseomonas nitratireducens TaxID=2820810 RepID=A0ABS4AWB8_9PROT|nr:glycosyltransferase [Neoroseomonas nitratireducens]MBP0465653.1 glycosyltransferase [Neoroseomonas nitratireducens]